MIYFIDIPKLTLNQSDIISWLNRLATEFNVSIDQLQYNFVDENSLLKMNQEFLKHDTHTDIITFSYRDDATIEAEIYISIDRMLENAKLNHETVENELLRLLSHGLLHCIGHNDHTEEEKSAMRTQENRCIEMFHVKQMKNV